MFTHKIFLSNGAKAGKNTPASKDLELLKHIKNKQYEFPLNVIATLLCPDLTTVSRKPKFVLWWNLPCLGRPIFLSRISSNEITMTKLYAAVYMKGVDG